MRAKAKWFGAVLVCLMGGALSGGCGSDDDSPASVEQRLCERGDECNFLPAGVSAADCTDATIQCTADLVTSQRNDWYSAVEDCLSMQNCQNVLACYSEVPNC